MTKHCGCHAASRRARRAARSVIPAGRERRYALADENEGRRLAFAPQRPSSSPCRGRVPGVPALTRRMWMTGPTKLGTCCLICTRLADPRTAPHASIDVGPGAGLPRQPSPSASAGRASTRVTGEQSIGALALNRFNRFSSAVPGWLAGALVALEHVLCSASGRACTPAVRAEAWLSQPR
jgi:hypothetical protein